MGESLAVGCEADADVGVSCGEGSAWDKQKLALDAFFGKLSAGHSELLWDFDEGVERASGVGDFGEWREFFEDEVAA